MPEPDKPPSGEPPDHPQTTAVGNFFTQGERVVYILIAALLLVAAVATCGHAVWAAVKEVRQGGGLAPGLFTLLSDLLLALIVLELLRTVGRFIRKEEPGVGVADLTPFLIVGAISCTRRLLAIGANLSITESTKAAEDPKGAGSLTFDPEHFRQAMIELGVNGALIVAITVSLVLIGRHLQNREDVEKGDETA